MDNRFDNTKSLGGNMWKFAEFDENTAELVAARYGLPPVVAQIMVSRGIDMGQSNDFLYPKLQNLMPDPACLKDMEKAAARIAAAVENGEQTAIIGDYDVDGATSSSLLKLFLQSVGCEVPVHIPEREEGYGPSKSAVDEFAAIGTKLLITTDCGTTAFEVLEYARDKGMDVIVLDHHEAETKLPDIYAVVNPKRLDESDEHPDLKYLAAVGVVFLTVVAVNRQLRKRGFYVAHPAPELIKWLDLVALGTVCDVVPLLGLNRAFVRQGLKIMSLRQNCGIKALIDKASVTEAPSSYHLGYVLGPRINAGGRVGEASIGNRLLCAANDFEAATLADKLDSFNALRKEIEAYVLLQAIETLEGTPQQYPIAFVYGQDWHQGVIGIVAGKLKERYNLPSFVMSVEADEVKGSARSVPGLNIGALVMAAKEKGLLTKGGGHNMAAGFSLEESNLEAFRTFAGEYAEKYLGTETLTPVVEIDGTVSLNAATPEFADGLALLEPFGAGNPEPRLMLSNVRILHSDIVGSGHIRCQLGSLSGGTLKAMAFRAADNEVGKALLNHHGEVFNLAGTLRKDNWQGRNQVQFIIEDAMRG